MRTAGARPGAAGNARLKGGGTERATPHKLALCVLIKLYVSPDEETEDSCPLEPGQVRQLQLFIVQSIKAVDTIIEPVLVETCSDLTNKIAQGGSVAQFLRDTLAAIDSPDALFDLLESLRELLLPPTATSSGANYDLSGRPTNIEPSCVFGVFLRRVLLACKRSFEALSRLFHELGLYASASTSGLTIPGITPRHKGKNLKRKKDHEAEDEEWDEAAPTPSMAAPGEHVRPRPPAGGQPALPLPMAPPEPPLAAPRPPPVRTSRHVPKRGARITAANTFRSYVSRRQLQYHLQCMVEDLEAKVGMVSPAEVEAKVSEMLAISPDLPRAHFVRYMNCLVHREYQGAVDSLHTYFDYCMRSGGPTSSAAIATASAAAIAASGGRGAHSAAAMHASAALGRRRPMMQYAVLNLAALHFQFGHRREAMLAIQETVRVAQQNGDHVCVVFALSWLFRLASGAGGQETSQLLRRCLSRARELGLDHIQGLSHLVTAQYHLLAPSTIPTAMPPPVQGFFGAFSGRSAPARVVWHSLERGVEASSGSLGSYVEAISAMGSGPTPGNRNMHNRMAAQQQQDELYATGMPSQSSRAAMSQAIRAVNASLATPSSHLASASNTAGKSLLVQSAAWEAYGHSSLSWLGALTHLCYYSNQAGTAASDTCLAICRLASAQASSGKLSGMCPGAYSVPRADRNAYIGALLLLLQAKKAYPHPANNIIVQTLVYLLQSRAIARGDVIESLMLGSTLRALTPSQQSVSGLGGDFFGEGLHVSAQAQWVDALRAMGRLTEAHNLTHDLVATSSGLGLHLMNESMDLTLAQIFLDSGSSGVAALPYTLRCLARAEKTGKETLYSSATVKLAACQLRMGHYHRAFELLLRTLPHVVAHGSLSLNGDVLLLVAKCHLHFSNEAADAPEPHLDAAREALEGAFRSFTNACLHVKAQEVLYLLSRVHNELAVLHREQGREDVAALHHKARDATAKRFLALREKQARPVVRIVGYVRSDEVLSRVACS